MKTLKDIRYSAEMYAMWVGGRETLQSIAARSGVGMWKSLVSTRDKLSLFL